jgi:hypothetical protein
MTGSQPHPARQHHWRAGCAERRTSGSGRRPPEKDPHHGHLADGLPVFAVSLNPRQGLAAGERLAALLGATGQHRDVLSAFAASLERMSWRVYEVRRVIRPRADDPARPANASRSLRAVAAGSRAQMAAVLRTMAKAEGASVEDEDGIGRAWLRRRGAAFPAAEHFLVAAPTGPEDKDGPASMPPGRRQQQPTPGPSQPPGSSCSPSPGQRRPDSMRAARTGPGPIPRRPPEHDTARCPRPRIGILSAGQQRRRGRAGPARSPRWVFSPGSAQHRALRVALGRSAAGPVPRSWASPLILDGLPDRQALTG